MSLIFSFPKYAFLNAKISAIKSYMLKPEDYEALLELKSVDEILDRLEKTHYKPYIVALSPYLDGALLAEASLYKWLIAVYTKIMKYMPDEDKAVAQGLLNRYEVKNLKLLLSAKMRNARWEEVESLLFPIDDIADYRDFFFEENFVKALKELSLGREILRLSLGEIWKGREKLMNKLLKEGDYSLYLLSTIELYYPIYLEKHLGSYKHIKAIRLLFEEIDVRNISVLLRMRERNSSKEEVAEQLLPGGLLSRSYLMDAYENERRLNNLIKRYSANPEDDIYKIEFDMLLALAKRKRREMGKVLSLDRIAGFFLYAEGEVDNIRLIVRGKEMSIKTSSIAELIA